MNFIKKFFLVIFLSIVLIYTVNITSIPKKIIIFESETLDLGEIFGIKLKESKEEVIQTSSNNNKITSKTITLSLFNIIDIKKVQVNTIDNVKVIPLGNTVGIKLYSSGVLVIGTAEIQGQKPYENSGIKEGDLIVEINQSEVKTTEKLIECVNQSNGKTIEIKYLRDGIEYITNIDPIEIENNNYKIGLWVRDGAVGIGTATFYEPSNGLIATLGHGIVDKDTDTLIKTETGEFTTSRITKIKKGEKGNPGEIRGVLNEEEIIGGINKNTKFGIYGTLTQTSKLAINQQNSVEVATKEEIQTGRATVILALEDGLRTEYEINIKKIYKNNTEDNKSMLIEITDKKLIEKTGGIIQGMSGAPIMQNGKFIGAITHVLVNEPLQGYAVFGETMIKQMNI